MTQAAFVAVCNEDKVLLVRAMTSHAYKDRWSLPGGLVETGETLAEGARREVIEETGIVCETGSLLSQAYNVEEDIHVSVFSGLYCSGEIVIQEDEILDAKWFNVSDALHLHLAHNTIDILQKL